jgi:hypothetical protein
MKTRFALATVCLMAVAVLSSPQAANAQCPFTLSGVYGFNRVGVLTNSPLEPYSFDIGGREVSIFASVGQFVADGAGHFTSITQTISVNGVVYRNDQTFAPKANAYTINDDCTGTLTIRSSILPTAVDYDFVFESGGTVLRFVGSDQATEVLGKAVFEGPIGTTCAGASTLSGAFGAQSFGVFFNRQFGLNVIAAEGRFAYDGMGGLSYAHVTASNNFNVTRWASATGGKYTVNSNCTGTVTIPGNAWPNYDFVLVNSNNQILLINADNNGIQAAIGEMTKQ